MQTILFSFLVGIAAGIIGVIYRHVLGHEPILHWWFRVGGKFESKWFYKPVWGCAKCFSGQFAGWFWLLVMILPAIIRHCSQNKPIIQFSIHSAQIGGVLILGLFCTISTAIATAILMEPVIKKCEILNNG